MPAPTLEFGRTVRRVMRTARWLSFSLIGVVFFLLAFRVADIYRAAADVHPLLGIAFLLAVGLAFAWLIGRPLWRFLRMPVAMRPPRMPNAAERTPKDLARHLEFVERYVDALRRNPEWEGDPEDIEEAVVACRALRIEAGRIAPADLGLLAGRVTAFEKQVVERLLAPLDRKVADVIRAEAFKVAMATAVSPYGSLDAFLVLWRNANLVSRIAVIYYGRPGARGTLSVLRDVAMATMVGAYLGDLAEVAGDAVGSLAGKTAGFFAGPLMEGCLNGVATLRIGYVAKGRCRAFSAWTERTAMDATHAALKEAGRFSAGLVSDVARGVGGGVMRITGSALSNLVERVTAIFRRPDAEPAPGATTA
jgi:hypothetical protein